MATVVIAATAAAAVAGLAAVVLERLLSVVLSRFSGSADGWPSPPPWWLVLLPVLGGLLYGPLVAAVAPEARGGGVPEVRRAMAESAGRTRSRVAGVKTVATVLSVGSGSSLGLEGPIVQVAAALGSVIATTTRLAERHLRAVVAGAAAGGIAAGFGAPLTAVVFCAELIIFDFDAVAIFSLVVASVTGEVVSKVFDGGGEWLPSAAVDVHNPVLYVIVAVAGLGIGVVAVAFVRVAGIAKRTVDRLWRGPEWLRPAAGGLLLGPLLLAVPQLYGTGHAVVANVVDGHYLPEFLLLLLAAKIVATSLAMATGGVGGVFGPLLFVGAAAGGVFPELVGIWLPQGESAGGVLALAGIAAAFAAATRAPATAVVIVVEFTGQYSLTPIIVVSSVAAMMVSQKSSSETIYTLRGHTAGLDIARTA